jgi:hypothetical protein
VPIHIVQSFEVLNDHLLNCVAGAHCSSIHYDRSYMMDVDENDAFLRTHVHCIQTDTP